jgi:lipoyl(octanoyl) transferase
MRVDYLGTKVSYADGMARMREAMARVDEDGPVLLLLEHAATITITRRGGMGAFVSPAERIIADGIEVVETDRGGDVTFHGPGQLVGYPIMRLGKTSLGCDVVGFVRALETAIIDACTTLGVSDAQRIDGMDADGHHLTGVWCTAPVVADETLGCNFHVVERALQKLCAIGIGLSAGVTRHGFAVNVSTDLERFTRHIVPCGLQSRGVTSLERVLAKPTTIDTVRATMAAAMTTTLARHISQAV